MNRLIPFLLSVTVYFLAASFAAAAPAGFPAGRLDGFKHGVNLSHWYAQSLTGQYDEARLASYMTPRDFKVIKGMGFDHVRWTLDNAPLFDPATPGTLKADAMANYDERLQGLLDAGLNVIVDLHPGDDYKKALHEDAAADAFVKNWAALAAHLKATDPDRVMLEILNEPTENWPTEQWRPLEQRALTAIRAAAPEHTVVVAAGKWSGADDLAGFEPFDDANLVYTFHWYEPFLFTHQSASWGWEPAKWVSGLPWPVAPADAAKVTAKVVDAAAHPESAGHVKFQIENGWYTEQWTRDKLQTVADWQEKHGGVPVYAGEFGVYTNAAPADSRYRWYAFAAGEFERHGWGWATWDYAGGFHMVTGEQGSRSADPKMAEALGLK